MWTFQGDASHGYRIVEAQAQSAGSNLMAKLVVMAVAEDDIWYADPSEPNDVSGDDGQ